MLKLYTHLYAWAYILNERQWGKEHDHAWAALINTSILLGLNVSALVAIVSMIGHFDIGTFAAKHHREIGLATMFGIPLLIWLVLQRTGRGPRLVESLRNENDREKQRMVWKLLAYLFASFILCSISWISFALLRNVPSR